MDKHEIITRLNEISSYFSFGRILGYISFFETVGIESQLKHGQESNRDRLLSTEIDFNKRSKFSDIITDIDAMLCDNDLGIIFIGC